MKLTQQILQNTSTPCYAYDMALLSDTLREVKRASAIDHRFRVHYAVKANANERILKAISAVISGADCVSGGEIKAAIQAGFLSSHIVFAGVGKTDSEILYALQQDIECFNVESLPELEIISELAVKNGFTATIALRVNPEIDAHTHKYITTGLSENKFGISLSQLDSVVEKAMSFPGINLAGLHFHIGSQITELDCYKLLCERVNDLYRHFADKGIKFTLINVGGGLGIDYRSPMTHPIPAFATYFKLFHDHLSLPEDVEIHFELGRAIVAQCGSLLSRVLYIKHGDNRTFAIVDAGMTDLIRPALYQAYHKIERLMPPAVHEDTTVNRYDIVGPICESSDVFVTDEFLPSLHRGDIIAMRSAGAYGEIMASGYNLRPLPHSIFYND